MKKFKEEVFSQRFRQAIRNPTILPKPFAGRWPTRIAWRAIGYVLHTDKEGVRKFKRVRKSYIGKPCQQHSPYRATHHWADYHVLVMEFDANGPIHIFKINAGGVHAQQHAYRFQAYHPLGSQIFLMDEPANPLLVMGRFKNGKYRFYALKDGEEKARVRALRAIREIRRAILGG